MKQIKPHRHLYVAFFLLSSVGAILSLHQTSIAVAAQNATVTPTTLTVPAASDTPVPISSLNPTLTATLVPSVAPTEQRTATPIRSRTPLPTNFPTDTPTTTPIVQAQPTVVSAGPLLAQEISLVALGRTNLDFISPANSQQFTFQLPSNWQPDGNNYLNLNVVYFKPDAGNATVTASLTTTLQVRFDNELAASITLSNDGMNAQNIVVPLRIGLLSILARHTHTIQVAFDTRNLCLVNLQGRISIRSDLSYFHFEYHEGSPSHNLANYPLPFFTQPLGMLVESTIIVVPTQYTAGDLQAAAALSAELGQLTGNKLQLRVATADSLSDQDQQNFNLIAVGQVGKNALIDGLYNSQSLPTVRGTDGSLSVSKTSIADTDGVVQLIANPKNPLRSILVLTSNTPEGLAKAVGAMAGPPSTLRLGGAVALVSDIRPVSMTMPNADLTFAALGYPDFTLTGLGTRTAEIHFTMPIGVTLSDGADLTLQYDLADTLVSAQTTLSVTMNDTQINSLPVGLNSAGTAGASGTHQLHVPIPPSSIKAGAINVLTLQLDVQADWHCNPPDQAATWFLIHSNSILNLPIHKTISVTPNIQLSQLPAPFNAMADLSDTVISLPQTPSLTDLEHMVRIASYIGSQTNGGLRFMPRVTLGALPSDITPAQSHFIVIGRPSTNTFLSQLNDMNILPQPFMAHSDVLKQVLDGVIYRLPQTYNIGILQSLPSPWSSDRVILVVSGTTEAGQKLAISVLLDGKYGPSDLAGNVLFANTSYISVVDTTTNRLQPVAMTPTLNATPVSQVGASLTPKGTATPIAEPTIPVYTVTPYPSVTPVSINNAW
jgi:hypothetical protein